MSKVLIVGDTHFSNRVPFSRKDDFPTTLIKKLEGLGELIKENNVDDVIFLGDLFNTRGLDLDYFTKVYKVFSKIKEETKVKFYTVVGNHDLLYRNRDLMDSSPITLLRLAGVFETTSTIETLKIGGLDFTFVDYICPVTEVKPATSENSVLIGHYFFLNGFSDSEHTLTDEICKSLGYKFYFLGHDHTPYEPFIKDYQVYRPGSFSRGTSQTNQVKRNVINVYLFNTDTLSVKALEVPGVLSSEMVYRSELLLSKDIDTSLSSLDLDFTKFLDAFKYDKQEDILETLEALNLDKDVKETLLKYLQLGGLIS